MTTHHLSKQHLRVYCYVSTGRFPSAPFCIPTRTGPDYSDHDWRWCRETSNIFSKWRNPVSSPQTRRLKIFLLHHGSENPKVEASRDECYQNNYNKSNNYEEKNLIMTRHRSHESSFNSMMKKFSHSHLWESWQQFS